MFLVLRFAHVKLVSWLDYFAERFIKRLKNVLLTLINALALTFLVYVYCVKKVVIQFASLLD